MSMEFDRDPRDREAPSLSDRSTVDTLRLVVAGVLGIMLALFVLMNTDKTKVDFVVTDVRLPLVIVLIGTAITGAIISHLGLYVWRRRRARER
jgi:uncharacterized integral membrane protein